MCADRWRKSDDDGPACGTGDVVPPPAPAQKIERWPSERTSTPPARHVPAPLLERHPQEERRRRREVVLVDVAHRRPPPLRRRPLERFERALSRPSKSADERILPPPLARR